MNSSTAIVPTTAQNKALLSSILEAKLTRTELMDLVIDKVVSELRTELDVINKQLEEPKVLLTLDEALKLVNKTAVVERDVHTKYTKTPDGKYESIPDYQTITISMKLPMDAKLPKHFVQSRLKRAALKKQKATLDEKLRAIQQNRRKARNELVKQALDSSSEGKNILKAIEVLKESITEKLLK